jgi:competence protein ComEA
MPTLHSHKKVFALLTIFLFGSCFISACSSKRIAANLPEKRESPHSAFLVNVNTADATELQKLPHVGPALAKKIIEHRARYGPFRRPEHLLIIDGLSEKGFRNFSQFISTG